MKISVFYFLLLFCLYLGNSFPIQAQNLTRASKEALNAAKNVSAVSKTMVAPPISTSEMLSFSAGKKFAPSTQHRYNALATSHKQFLYNIQRAFGVSAMKAGHNLQKIGAAPTVRPPLPTPEGEAFFVEDLSPLIPENQIGVGDLPVQENPQLIYRGMALNAIAIKNILQNGILLKDVTPASATKTLPFSSPEPQVPTTYPSGSHPVINFTKYPVLAHNWATMNLRFPNIKQATIVLVSIRSYDKGEFIVREENIRPEQIYDVIATLKVDGKIRWCKVEITENGYKITPYTKKQYPNPSCEPLK